MHNTNINRYPKKCPICSGRIVGMKCESLDKHFIIFDDYEFEFKYWIGEYYFYFNPTTKELTQCNHSIIKKNVEYDDVVPTLKKLIDLSVFR